MASLKAIARGISSLNGLSGNVTLTSTGGTVTITPSGSNIDLEVSGSGDVLSVSNADGTLTISPTSGNVVASLNLAHANTWTATQTFSNSTYSALFTGGNVGIMTAGPTAPLDVYGQAIVGLGTLAYRSLNVAAGYGLTVDHNSNLLLRLIADGVGSTGIQYNQTPNRLDFVDIDHSNLVGLTLTMDGTAKVGIGATSPSQKLHVEGNVAGGAGLNTLVRNTNSTGSAGSFIQADGSLIGGFQTFGTAYSIGSLANTANAFSTGALTFLSDSSTGTGGGSKISFITGGYNNSPSVTITALGQLGMGTGLINPTALLHLNPGSTTAGFAPLKFTSGSLLTTPEVGAVEYLTDKWYGTISTGAARKEFALVDSTLTPNKIPVATTNGRLVDSSLSANANGLLISEIYSGSTLTSFGDSITVGVNGNTGSPTANSYINLLAAETSWTITNNAVSGTELTTRNINTIYPFTTTAGSQYLMLSGYNDMRHVGSSATGLLTYKRSLYAALAWLAIPQTARISAQTFTTGGAGTWSGASLYGGNVLGRFTTSGNCTLTGTIYGNAIYIGYENRAGEAALSGTQGGVFTVTVDGTVLATVDTNVGTSPVSAQAFWPEVIRIGGLSEGAHTVVITVGTLTSQAVNIDYIASNNSQLGFTQPKIYLGGTLRMSPTGYSTGTTGFTNGSDAAVESFNEINRLVCRELGSDGLDVIFCDVGKFYNPNDATQLGSDNVHPTDIGYSKLYNGFIKTINRLPSVGEREGAVAANRLAQKFQVVNGFMGFNTDNPLTLGMMVEQGVTPVSPSALSGTGFNRAFYVQGNGGAYLGGRDVTNSIEFLMGVSAAGYNFVGSVTAHDFAIRTNNTNRVYINNSTGNVSIGSNTSPLAALHLPAGTTTANTAPLMFTSGSLNTTAQVGAHEFLTDDLYLTITTGAQRCKLALVNTTLTSGQMVFTTTNGRLATSAAVLYASARGQIEIDQTADTSANGLAIVNNGASASFRLWVDSSGLSRIDGGSGGTTNVLINGSGTGKVGIGSSSPLGVLDVQAASGKHFVVNTDLTSLTVSAYSAAATPTDLYFQANSFHFIDANSLEGITYLDTTTGPRIGIYNNAPTARLDIKGSQTTVASLRIRSGTAPTTPNDGDIWYDGSHLQARLGANTYQLDQQTSSNPSILATITGIDGKTVANTALYTVPAGKTAIVTGYTVRCSAASAITVGASAGIGNVAGTNNIAASQSMSTLTATTSTFEWPIVGASITTAAASIIYFNLGTAATGTSQTLVVDLIGYLV